MDSLRKIELYDNMLGYLVELIHDEEELVYCLLNIGFTKEEILYELDWLGEESFNHVSQEYR